MLSKVLTGTVVGLDGVLIEVEVDVANRGFPTFIIVGLGNKAVDEAKDRVRTAITNASLEMPDSRITVNLAPADLPKMGSGYDLPIAVGILAASGMVKPELLENSLCIGELSLQGNLRPVTGMISIAQMAKSQGITRLFVPAGNAKEASCVGGVTVYPLGTINDFILYLNGEKELTSVEPVSLVASSEELMYDFDFKDVKGQEQAKRALHIAAAGFHNIHLRGVPGAGKTLLSRAFPSLLPPLETEEVLEVSRIYSAVGMLQNASFITQPPFRSPHHTISRNGLIGGGTHPMPGEISLAHRGVLFLDELPEFPRSVLEALRQPLEDGLVSISRAAGSLTFPCRFLLLAASNPCPCGYLGHPTKQCVCMPGAILTYKKRLSGPLLDRIDLHIDVPPVKEEILRSSASGVSSANMREEVIKARQRQHTRLKEAGVQFNSEMSSKDIKKYCVLSPEAETLLQQAAHRLSLSARSYFKIIKVSQTIADLEGSHLIMPNFIAEALQYRVKEE